MKMNMCVGVCELMLFTEKLYWEAWFNRRVYNPRLEYSAVLGYSGVKRGDLKLNSYKMMDTGGEKSHPVGRFGRIVSVLGIKMDEKQV